jgi:hypothetical protein
MEQRLRRKVYAPLGRQSTLVMPGFDPGIHHSSKVFSKTMDCRVKPGNDSLGSIPYAFTGRSA